MDQWLKKYTYKNDKSPVIFGILFLWANMSHPMYFLREIFVKYFVYMNYVLNY